MLRKIKKFNHSKPQGLLKPGSQFVWKSMEVKEIITKDKMNDIKTKSPN